MMMMMKKQGISFFIKSFIIGAIVLLAIIAPFIHIKYNEKGNIYSEEYLSHKAKYKAIIKKRDYKLKNLISKLEEDSIDKDEYLNSYKEVIKKSNIELINYNKKKSELKESYKFFGFKSKRLFLQNIGVIVFSLVISFLFLNLLFNPITEKFKKRIFIIIGALFIFVSIYLLLWVLFSQRVYQGDFPKAWYQNILRFSPLITTILSLLLFHYYSSIEKWYKETINRLIVFIINSDKYIDSEDKENKHFADSMEVFEKIAK